MKFLGYGHEVPELTELHATHKLLLTPNPPHSLDGFYILWDIGGPHS
jgi:hypothetical protein